MEILALWFLFYVRKLEISLLWLYTEISSNECPFVIKNSKAKKCHLATTQTGFLAFANGSCDKKSIMEVLLAAFLLNNIMWNIFHHKDPLIRIVETFVCVVRVQFENCQSKNWTPRLNVQV